MRILAGVVAVLALGLVAGGLWWRSHPPEAFGDTDSFRWTDTRAGATYYAGLMPKPGAPSDVTVTGFRPRVRDTTHARLQLLMCTLRHDAPSIIGTAHGDLHQTCSSLRPVVGTTIDAGSTNDQLVVQIRPQRPGRLAIDSLDISYEVGHQHGTQHLDAELRLTPTA